MRQCKVWNGTYKGINYEVRQWTLGDGENWNYYIYIDERQLSDATRGLFMCGMTDVGLPSRRRTYDYYGAGTELINDLDWHGGLTFYNREGGIDEKPVVVKLGCDYAHYYDEGRLYALEDVERDARHTIDKLWELLPDLKCWCVDDGNFYGLSEGWIDSEGHMRTPKGRER